MKTTKEKDIDLIERYLDRKLSEEEADEVKERLGGLRLMAATKKKCTEEELIKKGLLIEHDPEFSALHRFRLKIEKKWKQASEYEKAKKQVATVIASEKKRKKHTIVYSIAAVLLIGMVIPLAIYNNRNNENKIAKTEEYQLGTDYPEYDAAIRYFDESYKQVSPSSNRTTKLGKPILFKWNSGLDVRTAIVIKQAGTDSIAWRVPIPSKIKEYELKKELPEGAYTWEMEGFRGKELFKVQ